MVTLTGRGDNPTYQDEKKSSMLAVKSDKGEVFGLFFPNKMIRTAIMVVTGREM